MVSEAQVEAAVEAAQKFLEIDYDGDDAFIRDDSIEAAVTAVLVLSTPISVPAWNADMGSALADVAAERKRQQDVEGWTPEHDDGHANGEMTAAAFGYLQSVMSKIGMPRFTIHDAPNFWPWAREWFKPSTARRDLVKAGALIIAEIERLDRLPPPPASVGGE